MRALVARLHREERGATLAIVAVSLIALFGMVVLTVDVGGLVVRRRHMVNANDAAALAGAQAFALAEGGALCGSNEGPAKSRSDALAIANQEGSTSTAFDTDCAEQTVTVVYERDQDLWFAPVLGFADSATVNATATAKWGQPTGGNPMPIELDPVLTRNCVFVDPDTGDVFKPPGRCPDGYWFNNQELTNSGWGMMNLQTWSETPNANCDNAGGANLLGDWITQSVPIQVSLTSIPMYVCTTDGGKSPNWFRDLESQIGKVFLFPVNDPAQMIMGPPTNRQQYAIIAFAPMKVAGIYDGTSAAAVGSSASCRAGYVFSSGGAGGTSVDLDLHTGWTPIGGTQCPTAVTGRFSISGSPTLYEAGSNKKINNGWNYNSSTHVITWTDTLPTSVEIAFDWRSGGACPGRTPDPNAWCLDLEWAGPQLIGTDPGPGGPGLGAQTVTLVK